MNIGSRGVALFVDGMDIYLKNLREATEKLFQLIRGFNNIRST